MSTTLLLGDCRALERLPDSLGQPVALRNLVLSECRLMTVPAALSLGQLVALETLELRQCVRLEKLPAS
jgi:Leucine-rich repeat (LRR) protein